MVKPPFLDAKPVKEAWSIYKVSDGTIIKLRYIIIKTRKSGKIDSFGNPVYDLNMKEVVGVIPPPDLLGTPTPFEKKELGESITDEDMSFTLVQQPWNEYKLEDGTTIKIMAVLTIVSKTSKYDKNGEPVYLLNFQPMVKGIPMRKPSEKAKES
jgi:hypothetical protein